MTMTTHGLTETSLERQTLEVTDQKELAALTKQIQKIDKVELHLHLGGSWPLSYLETIADPDDLLALTNLLSDIRQGMNYHEIFKVFGIVGKIVNTDKKVEEGVVALCENLAKDQITYVEIRTGLKDLESGLEGYLKSVLRGIQTAGQSMNIQVGFILSVRRNTPIDIVKETVELALKYRDQGIVGLDLSGDSTIGEGFSVQNELILAKEYGFPITLHIGESPKESKEQQLYELEKLSPERLGHGVHLCDEAIHWLKTHGEIPLEMCLSSAVMAGMISEHHLHPGLQLLMDGHPVVICTDDPLIFQISLSEECARTAQLTGKSVRDIVELQQQAKLHAFPKFVEV
jgi:adenosine deaminase